MDREHGSIVELNKQMLSVTLGSDHVLANEGPVEFLRRDTIEQTVNEDADLRHGPSACIALEALSEDLDVGQLGHCAWRTSIAMANVKS